MSQPVTYTFDVIAVTTFTVTTRAGVDAARKAAGALDSLDPDTGQGETVGGDIDVTYHVTCVAPRGPVYLFNAETPSGEPVDVGQAELFAEPITGTARQQLAELVRACRAAAAGDSNDEEINAALELVSAVEALLSIDN